jgi:hypothetical protein
VLSRSPSEGSELNYEKSEVRVIPWLTAYSDVQLNLVVE